MGNRAKRIKFPGWVLCSTWVAYILVALLVAATKAAEDETLILGSIEFPTSGSPQAQSKFINGVLALHSFWYEQSREFFIQAQQLDPSFAMAYWGEAMSYDNALGTVLDSGYEERGEAVLARMVDLDAVGKLKWTDRERGYYDALKLRFEPGQTMNVKRRGYGQAMDALVERYPDDDEARAFAALALMSFTGFDREQASHVVLVAAPLEEIYQRNSNHPGVLHYLIHVYDSVAFAPLGLRQARLYAKVASSSPHALHMPSHIYKHLAMWPEVVAANILSYETSVRWQQGSNRPLHMRDFHTFNWLLDTYLTLGRMDEARELMIELDTIETEIATGNEDPGHFPSTAKNLRQLYQNAIEAEP